MEELVRTATHKTYLRSRQTPAVYDNVLIAKTAY